MLLGHRERSFLQLRRFTPLALLLPPLLGACTPVRLALQRRDLIRNKQL